jgi:C-terminal processing protease CtpA/Prc
VSTTERALDNGMRSEVIEGLLSKLHAYYIFPDVAEEIEQAIRRRLSNGEYDALTTGDTLCEALTAHLQEVSHDKHLRVFYSVEPQPIRADGEPRPEEHEEFRQFGVLHNFGVAKVERLSGNIGYLDLRGFFPAEFGAETAVAAMNVLANTNALIVDVRQNGGGDPAMIALISSYLFTQPTHLNSLYWRQGDRTQQFWTMPYVPGPRYGDKPVYVLTSGDTFSGAEEFAYNLKNLKRATLIGEVTRGGAHPVDRYAINEHVAATIPVGRAINPITQTNWEGTGVLPDIEVPRDDALKVAHHAALTKVLEAIGDASTGPFKGLKEEAETALAEITGMTQRA